MLFNYLKTSLRNLIKRRGFSFINVGGLALGIASFILIGLYVQNEVSYDRFHERADRIYRLGLHLVLDNNETNAATVSAPVMRGLVDEIPEIEASTRLNRLGVPVLRVGDKAFSEEEFFWADSSVFDVFTIPFIRGNPKTALREPQTMLLTRSTAEKYFGDEDPVGKTIQLNGEDDFTVTGVVEDVPQASHLHYDFLAAMSSAPQSRRESWASNNIFQTYFLLDAAASADGIPEKLDGLVERHVHSEISDILHVTPDQFMANGGEFAYTMIPLTDIHLKSHLLWEQETNGNIIYVWIFAAIAIAILLIACINYVNLATAISVGRAREVGIRKTVGSTRTQLIGQFFADSMVLSLLAVGLALVIVEIGLPKLNVLTEKNLGLDYFGNPVTIPALIGFAALVGLLAGSYPAFFLSSFQPMSVLRGRFGGSSSKGGIRNGLVVFQYAISAVLVIASMVVYGQLEYIQNSNLGFSGEQVFIVNKADDIGQQIFPMKDQLRQQQSVVAVSNSSSLFNGTSRDNMFRVEDRAESEMKHIWLIRSDAGFADTYRLQILDGRYFSDEILGDTTAIVLNETAVRLLDLEDPVGKVLLESDGDPQTIIGIVRDFNVESLQAEIKAIGFQYFGERSFGPYLSVRVAGGDFTGVLSRVEEEWYKVSEGQAFEYEFFDDYFAEHFLQEKTMGQILGAFSILAILIACLGLFGLAAFVTTQRTKEIGIRKALGASASGIVTMLFRDFGRWILIANVIAWPIAYFAMSKWLDNFAYHSDIGLTIFPLSLGVALVIALGTISYQAIRAARANPVVALQHE